jgi:hypothetical protein
MTQSEFIKIASWPSPKLWKYCVRLTEKLGHQAAVDHLMKLRREMQVELGKYSKTSSFDNLQQRAVEATENMLRWCKGYFMSWAMREVIMKFPEKAKSPTAVKYASRQMWEAYVKTFHY